MKQKMSMSEFSSPSEFTRLYPSLCCIFQHKTALDTLLDWYQENETRDSEFLTIYNNVVELLKEKTPGKG